MTRRISTSILEAMASQGHAIAILALEQRIRIANFKGTDEGILGKQVRDLTAENTRLRHKIAELQSITRRDDQ